ncbi:hypothetical protein MXB_561 [Myxobolus squamalis]|nr:hypothetical protein MXB_561 [Myxobolus squamalis]
MIHHTKKSKSFMLINFIDRKFKLFFSNFVAKICSNLTDMPSNYKMVIVVRKDLLLPKGKAISQSCHAALASYKLTLKSSPEIVRRWEREGCGKIVLGVKNEDELYHARLHIYESAISRHLSAVMIRDAGKTTVDPGTLTAVGIGPDLVEKIDTITRHLKLL